MARTWTPATAHEDVTGDLYCVRFRRVWTVYYPGDVAGFREKIANMLINRRLAEPVDVVTEGTPPPDAEYALRYPVERGREREE